ncbi:MAG: hypothetical protein F6K58_23810 [Symploca sp. SIO2E9]|nr:hypothetical protein [Symploca sp. SIO2E9]
MVKVAYFSYGISTFSLAAIPDITNVVVVLRIDESERRVSEKRRGEISKQTLQTRRHGDTENSSPTKISFTCERLDSIQ